MSLEGDFWQAFRDVAKAKNMALNELAAQIDAERGLDTGLASAIRLYVFRWYRDQLTVQDPST